MTLRSCIHPASLRVVPAVLLAALALGACFPALELAPEVQLFCDGAADCPSAWHCAAAIGRCVRDDNPDRQGPTLQRVIAESSGLLALEFGEPLFGEGLEEPGRYAISAAEGGEGLEVLAAASRGPQTVVLSTSPQRPGGAYRVAVEGLFDLYGNPMERAQLAFAGFGDSLSPDPLSPPPDAAIRGPEVLFVWSARRGANGYTLQVARDEAMTEGLLVRDASSLQTTALVELEPGSYYWRVRSDGSEFSAPLVVHVFSDTVHVHCPAEIENCFADSSGAGTSARPFRTIAEGLRLAARLALSTVAIAGRGGEAFYAESVVVADGLALLGGFEPGFTLRDPSLYPTTIRSGTSPTVAIPFVRQPTRVAGLRIEVESPETRAYALWISSSSSALVVEGCEVSVESLSPEPDELVAVVVHESGDARSRGPTLRGNRFVCDRTSPRSAAVALSLRNSSPTLTGNLLRSAGWGPIGAAIGLRSEGFSFPHVEGNELEIEGTDCTGIALSMEGHVELTDLAAALVGNQLRVEGGGSAVGLALTGTYGVRVEGNGIGVRANSSVAVRVKTPRRMVVANNVIVAGTSAWESERNVGVELSDSVYSGGEWGEGVAVQFAHNTVLLGRAADYGSAVGLALLAGAQPSLVNNLFVALPCPGALHGVWEEDATSTPVSLRHNAFAGFGVLYRDHLEGELRSAAELGRLAGQAIWATDSAESRVDGNVELSALAEALFVEVAGPGSEGGALLRSDLRLLAGAPETLRLGGLEASSPGYCLPSFQNAGGCAPIEADYDQAPRSPPVSLGAFERD